MGLFVYKYSGTWCLMITDKVIQIQIAMNTGISLGVNR